MEKIRHKLEGVSEETLAMLVAIYSQGGVNAVVMASSRVATIDASQIEESFRWLFELHNRLRDYIWDALQQADNSNCPNFFDLVNIELSIAYLKGEIITDEQYLQVLYSVCDVQRPCMREYLH